jgi:hypothetical protein
LFLGAAVAEVKNYGLSGVHRTLQLGKQGPVLVGNADTDSFTVTLQDGATLTNMGGANATNSAHFITKAQLDVVYTEAVFKANVNYNDSSPILLGNISSGTKTIITTLTIGTAFDDANAIVTIGTTGNNTLLMSDDYCEIENTGVYQTINTVEIASDTALNIYVTQAGATTGAGNVLVSVVDGPVVDGGTINYGAGNGGIALADLSVATAASPSGNGSLSYNNSTGVFTFTPADVGSGSGGDIGNFVFNGDTLELSGTGGNDMYIKSPDDLFLDALGDDVIIRSDDDTRIRVGYNFTSDSYSHEYRFNDSGELVFYNSTQGNDYGFLRMFDNNDSRRTLSLDGSQDVFIRTSNENYTWKFNNSGTLTLPSGGDIVDSSGNSVLSTGGIALTDISVSVAASPSGNGSLSYDNTTGAFTFTPADLSSVAGNYGNSNVVTLLSSFGSNSITTTGNITAGNISGNISITGNVVGTSPNVTLVAGSYSATFDNTGVLTLPAMGGNEGGEIAFTQAPNSTLGGSTVVIDNYVDRIRFFESGGDVRGAYIDLSIAATGVGTLLNNRASGIVNAGVDVTLGNLKARIPTSGNRSLQVSTVSGSYSVYGSAQYTAGGTIGGTNIVSGFAVSVTTTPAYLSSGNNFGTAGDAGQWIIMDTGAGLAWRISFIIGASFNNNLITIERLV